VAIMMDSMFESAGVEAVAMLFVLLIAVPSILMLCLVLDEAPLKLERSLDDSPVFFGVWSATDMFGQGWGTLICLFFVSFMLFGFAIMATAWYTVWRGSVAWSAESTSLSDMMGGAALLQQSNHALQHSSQHVAPHQLSSMADLVSSVANAATSGPALVAIASGLPKAAAAVAESAEGRVRSLRNKKSSSQSMQALQVDSDSVPKPEPAKSKGTDTPVKSQAEPCATDTPVKGQPVKR